MGRLDGRAALGLYIFRLLAAQGASVVVNDVNGSTLAGWARWSREPSTSSAPSTRWPYWQAGSPAGRWVRGRLGRRRHEPPQGTLLVDPRRQAGDEEKPYGRSVGFASV